MKTLNGLGWKIHNHLKQHRPKMFRAFKEDGTLNQYILNQQNSANERPSFLEDQGYQSHEAMELIRDQIFPPSEEDVPNLGESPKPYLD